MELLVAMAASEMLPSQAMQQTKMSAFAKSSSKSDLYRPAMGSIAASSSSGGTPQGKMQLTLGSLFGPPLQGGAGWNKKKAWTAQEAIALADVLGEAESKSENKGQGEEAGPEDNWQEEGEESAEGEGGEAGPEDNWQEKGEESAEGEGEEAGPQDNWQEEGLELSGGEAEEAGPQDNWQDKCEAQEEVQTKEAEGQRRGCKRKRQRARGEGANKKPKAKKTKNRKKSTRKLSTKSNKTKSHPGAGQQSSAAAQQPSNLEAAPAALDIMPSYKNQPRCCKCKELVEPLRARLTGKRQGCWQCTRCATRYTQLHRAWGGWPPSEWESFTEDEKTQFWKNIGESGSKEDMERVVLTSMSKRVIETRKAGAGGEYLPLSVYSTRGFDSTIIEAKCADWKPCPLFGKVYRLEIEYQSREKEEQRVREAIVQSIQNRKAGAKSKATTAKATASKRGSQKDTKPVVATKQMQSMAVKVLAKTSPLRFGMEAALARDKIVQIPKVHRQKLKSLLAGIQKLEAQAQDTVSNQALLNLQMLDVTTITTEAQNHLSLVVGMLNSL